jgi:Cd2+/Zn2+-exporting ATPase
LAAAAETFSNHPIALSIQNAYTEEIGKSQAVYDIDKSTIADYNEIAGHGISVKSSGKTILAGNYKLMEKMGVPCEEAPNAGTQVYIAEDNIFAGVITISDEIKPDSRNAVAALKSKGVSKVAMLTGDTPQIAEAIAAALGLDEAHAGLLPHQKVEKLETLDAQKRIGGKLAFVGDGINDAPVLARADVGVAMGGLGSDAAIEAADVVLMTDEPRKLADAIDIARFTKRVVWQNIAFALGVKGIFLCLGAIGIAGLWEAVFADVGVALLAVLNASRAGKGKP